MKVCKTGPQSFALLCGSIEGLTGVVKVAVFLWE